MGAEVKLPNLLELNSRMRRLANAVRLCVPSDEVLSLDKMLIDIADFVGYDVSEIKEQLGKLSRVEKFTVMAEIVRAATGETSLLSLSRMAELIEGIANSSARVGKRCYATLGEAITAAKAEDTITLLRDITLENVTYTFFINKAITIDGKKANGTNHKITANLTTDYMSNLFQANADFTMQNVDVTLTSKAKSSVINGGANITVKNCTFDCSRRGITFFRASDNKTLSISNSKITGGNCVLYLYQCSGDAKIVDNSLIDCRADVSDDGTSAVYVSGCDNNVTVNTATINSKNIGVQLNKGSCNLCLEDYSVIETTTSHAIYAGGVGVSIYVYFAQTAYVESSEETDPYFTVNTSNYSIKFAEEYGRYAMCSGAKHSEGSGGFALEFFDNYQDAINNYFETLFTYRADVANEFAAKGHTFTKTEDRYEVPYYLLHV